MATLITTLRSSFSTLNTVFLDVSNKLLPPEERSEMLLKIQEFAINKPKLAAFLTAQIVFTGLPLVLFLTFVITVFLFSLITALLIGFIAAFLFTALMVGVALIVALPTVFMTTFGATFVFLWGLGGYYILNWLNEKNHPYLKGTVIGDKINDFTGGRMGRLLDGARRKQEDIATKDDQESKRCSDEKYSTDGSTAGSIAGSDTPSSSTIFNRGGQGSSTATVEYVGLAD